MENFKEIIEKCLACELSGTFVLRNGDECISSNFKKDQSLLTSFRYLEDFYYSDNGHCYISTGYESKFDIVDFIPDNMQKKIEINIPEGKVPVMEQTENGVVITWKEKEITYADVISKLVLNQNAIYELWSDKIHEGESSKFYKKVEVLRKLTNIRNYFGKPENMLEGWCIFEHNFSHKLYVDKVCRVSKFQVVFAEQEHAEQAINMLGDELKYLFEPW